MTTCSMNDTAKNGFAIHTHVELLWEDSEPFAKLPFRVVTMVNGNNMATSHHRTNRKAIDHAHGSHKVYLETHSKV